tara:strand:- start:544 stop:1227 length:684 start_codon:yes stop_codon:yes gene_type:complete
VKKIVIAIDGHSSTGKSTLAKELAKALGYIYVDSGSMYRAITLNGIKKGFTVNNKFNNFDFIKSIDDIKLDFKVGLDGSTSLFLNNKKLTSEIRSMEVSSLVSKVAAIPEIRKFLVKKQRYIGVNKGIVMDGRDIGTVVFPKAELKIFMTASSKTRAYRRLSELTKVNSSVSFGDVYENINSRDYNDSNRKDSPLKMASDAKKLDNTNLSESEQFDLVMSWVKRIIN